MNTEINHSEFLRQRVFDKTQLIGLLEIIDQGRSAAFVSKLIDAGQAKDESRDSVVQRAMDLMQALVEVDPMIGCCLMIHLWPIASDLRMHQECDAISLYICDPRNRLFPVAKYLESLARMEPAGGLQRVYLDWAGTIQESE
jgi:hypothetical protein